ncbi:hypothetical protein G6F43_008687 [Rhizopus delemar]|nr:hypothetical protein G6F43_008687 [Rhizopus delemar]
MDKRLLQKQYQQQFNELLAVSHVDSSASLSMRLGLHQQRLSDALSKPTTTRQAQKIPIKESTIGHQGRDSLITEYPYVLVQDNDEQDRMVTQHYLLRTLFSSDFCSPIRSQLQKGIVVLDVGCGPGTWTMEMSTAFPKSTFIGIDQSTFFPKDIKPRNCHFRTCYPLVQEQLPLPFPDNSIDYIYQRDMNWGLMAKTWQPLIQEYLRILKPGGWIEFMEPDFETQNNPKSNCDLNDKLVTGLCLRQQDPYVVHRLPTVLSINGFKQIETILQPCRLGWEVTQDANLSSTIGSVAVTEKQEKASNYSEFSRAMSSQYMLLLKSLRPWLSIVMNLSHEKYDDYIADFPAEWSQARTYINWHCIIAQKPHYI